MRALLSGCAVALALCVSAGATNAASDTDEAEPMKLVRTLQFLQDSIAQGSVASDDARRRLIDLVGKRFLASDPAMWKDSRNAEAALLYVLNGGNPAVLERLPRDEESDPAEAQLIAAVEAYAGGSESAKALWAKIDLASVPMSLVGPAALVKANLLMADSPTEALQFADLARLESPGTLVEEAAIRRSIEIAAKLGDPERFDFYATRYAIRFPRSTYGAIFRKRFSESYLLLSARAGADKTPRLDAILEPLGEEDRRAIFLEVARRAIVEARMPLALTAAQNAVALSVLDNAEKRRAEFYLAAAEAVSGESGDSRNRLDALNPTDVAPEDHDLLLAVRAIVDQIQRWPKSDPKINAAEIEEPQPADGSPTVGSLQETVKGALGAAVDILERAGG